MKLRTLGAAGTAIGLLAILPAPAANNSVNITYHWHLHQPIYWPEKHPSLNRVQYAAESVDIKASGGNRYPGSTYAHPRNNLAGGDGEYDAVFDKDDRRQVYQFGGKNSIATLSALADAGASVSYSGALMDDVWSFGKDNRLGYQSNWNDGYKQARAWKTSGGFPKADMVGMTYHHAFSPLLPKSVLRKEIQIFKEVWWKSWGGQSDKSDHSKGFWPVEAAFSETMIPVLVEEGYQWSIVANSHLARTCPNYMNVATRGTGGYNMDPPNRADQLGPSVPAGQWYSGTRDARGGTFPAPYAYQAHQAKYVNPETGAEQRIVLVPMCDFLSYENGYGTMGTGVIDAKIAPFNDTSHPCIVVLAHDGDNAWGGGSSYFFESVPNLMNEAASKGHHPTTIQQFLADNPVPAGDLVHIEDGAWVNAASDWGHPQFINWLWPPTRAPSDPARSSSDPRTWYDFENPGWTEDWRNWAVLVAGANYCETAEQITISTGGSVEAWKIQEPVQRSGASNSPNAAEQAWHYYLGGLDSGFMYYGTSLDDEVKQSLACNRAISLAQPVIDANPGLDHTAPTVFKPQRFPWNPGGKGYGPLTGYKAVGMDGNAPWSSDFYIWTHVFDVSGLTSVKLFVREDSDGVNPLSDNANETFAGGAGVGAWKELAMTRRTIAKGNVTSNAEINFFIEPQQIADYCFAKVTGYRNRLLDYYVEATDSKGNVQKSDIQHVYVEDDGSPLPAVTFSANPSDCEPLVVSYNSTGRVLAAASPVILQLSFDGGLTWTNRTMSGTAGGQWTFTNSVPADAPSATVWFRNGASDLVDNNGGTNWSTAIVHCPAAPQPSTALFSPTAPAGCDPVTITYHPNDGPLKDAAQVYIHVGRNGWSDVPAPDPAMARAGDAWVYTNALAGGTYQVNCCFNDGSRWDSNGGANWNVTVTGCTSDVPPEVALAQGSPIVNPDPAGQNGLEDAFDLQVSGGYAGTTFQGGFGSFGSLYLNYDATNLYVGAMGCDLVGANNAMVIFLGVDTLGDNAYTLWDISGLPHGLDQMHNAVFTQPMDIAILLGDEYGDGTYTNFSLGDGYDFGQGLFYLSASGQFVPVGGAVLSQFDGTGVGPTGSEDADGDRLMNRWEAKIPWSSLNCTNGVASLGSLTLAGLVASSTTSGNDRFISGNYLGSSASGSLTGNNYGTNVVTLTPLTVGLPPADSDEDGIPDAWETVHFGGLGIAGPTTDFDGDGAPDRQEQIAGTLPTNALSVLRFTSVRPNAGDGFIVRWQSAEGRRYALYRATNLLEGFTAIESGIPATPDENIVADSGSTNGPVFYQVRVE